MGELGAGDVNGTRPSRVARIWSRSMWNPSETSSTRRLSLPANQRATPASEAYVLAPAGSATTAPSGSPADRKSTRLNSSHSQISYAVFCLKKKTTDPHAHLLDVL